MATHLYIMNVKITLILHVFVCSQVKFTFQKDVPYNLQNGESSEGEIVTSFKSHHMLKKRQVIKNHGYYTSKVMTNTPDFNEYWEDLNNSNGHKTIVKGYRKAIQVDLKDKFRFYGNNIARMMITNSGFLSMAQFPHQYLAATQYIAPLMANFDPTINEDSNILFKDSGNRFVVEWQNVYLQDKNDTKPFHFQTTVHTNGTIYFAYKQVGLGVKRRTLYEYDRLDINFKLVRSGTVVILDPLKTCNIAKDCATCLTQDDSFDCKWCPMVGRCSDGIDWLRQEWLGQDCDRKAFDDSTKCNSPVKEPESNTLSP
ncbi:plexin domain-containing protein 1-like [Saccostrea cucullata]|uniref:plexin domain-containing protein 1-like n=1 Tax=Saccostrea cuccullata TaxID=36930 RepID=UPI002ED2F8DC